MKRILTNNIVENTRRQPFNKASLEHIQEGFIEIFTALVKNFTENTTDYFRLHGLVDSDADPTDWDISAGAVWFDGEVYLVDAFAGSHGSDVPVLTIDTTYRAGDPVTFSDNNTFNVHEIKKMVITLAASGSGDVDYEDLLELAPGWVTTDRIANAAVTYEKINHTVARHYFSSGSHIDNLNDAKTGGIAHVSGADTNSPAGSTTSDTFLLIITDSGAVNGETVQTAIQLKGSSGGGAGTIYTRTHSFIGDTWSSWTTI